MYRKILVPLDGSTFGERVIPLALGIARRTGATVELAHVHEPVVWGGGAPMPDPRFDADVKHTMRAELERLRERIAATAGMSLTATFLEGEIVPTLQAHVDTRDIDLVVMTTHGRGGVSRAWLGSVADALVREVRIPVLLARPSSVDDSGGADKSAFRRILVTLDGSAFAEEVLAHAVAVGTPNHTEYLLLRVVSPLPLVPQLYSGGALPSGGTNIDRQERDAEHYLTEIAAQVLRSGNKVTTHAVVHQQPARGILDFAREWDVDLIALTTHGHGALARLVLGGVADKVIRAATVPTLVCRPVAVKNSEGDMHVETSRAPELAAHVE